MSGARGKGQPLVALLAILAGWAGGRISTWDGPESWKAQASQPAPSAGVRPGVAAEAGFVRDPATGPQSLAGAGAEPWYPYPLPQQPSAAAYPMYYAAVPVRDVAGWSNVHPAPQELDGGHGRWFGRDPTAEFPAEPTPGLAAPRYGAGALPQGMAPLERFSVQPYPSSAVLPGPIAHVARPKRWSADSWALVRRDGAGPFAAAGLPASYGASQAGAVLRYRLAMKSAREPMAYMRTTSTLGGQAREMAAAIGLSARPVPSIPVTAAVEGRVTEWAGRRRFQPVAMAITQLQPFELPVGFRGEAYGQAGYVAGRFATPFVDGQFRADHRALRLGTVEARLGGGVWGGVQKGAGRLDAGPSATIAMPFGGGMFGRVAVDWRFRVVGDARPGSGPAVTLSAGF